MCNNQPLATMLILLCSSLADGSLGPDGWCFPSFTSVLASTAGWGEERGGGAGGGEAREGSGKVVAAAVVVITPAVVADAAGPLGIGRRDNLLGRGAPGWLGEVVGERWGMG